MRCLCALLALCLLCACGADTPQSGAPDAPETQSGAADAPAQGTEAAGPLAPLSCSTDTGCYTAVHDRDAGTALLCYVDYASASELPLCSQPACTHDSEACAAWFAARSYVSNPVAGESGAIFYVVIDASQPEEWRYSLWAADADGANRRRLLEGASGDCNHMFLAEDGAFVYYTYYCIPDGGDTGRDVVARVPIAGGAQEILFYPDTHSNPSDMFLGLSGRDFVLWDFDWGEPIDRVYPENATPKEMEALDEQYEEQWRQKTGLFTVFFVNADTGERRQLDTWTQKGGGAGRSLLWYGGRLYWCDDQNAGPVHWLDPQGNTGELPALAEGENTGEEVFTLGGAVQDRLILRRFAAAGETIYGYAVDTAGGGAEELRLRTVANATERPLPIYGKSPDSLFVQYGEQNTSTMGFYEDGTPRRISHTTHSYGMISYEDYFAGVPNYRPIEMPYGFETDAKKYPNR